MRNHGSGGRLSSRRAMTPWAASSSSIPFSARRIPPRRVRLRAFHLPSRTISPSAASDSPAAPGCSPISSLPTRPRWWNGCRRRARWLPERRISTSSAWARPRRTPPSRSRETRGTPTGCRGAQAAGLPRRLPPALRHSGWEATRADPSGSRLPFAASTA